MGQAELHSICSPEVAMRPLGGSEVGTSMLSDATDDTVLFTDQVNGILQFTRFSCY